MVPKIIHFIYVGGRPFSFIHFLAVYTAWKVNRPQRMFLHHTEEPCGEWWALARPLVELNRVADVTEVYGNPVTYPAHKADVIRLDVLRRYGGIYLDLDVVSLNPFDPLLDRGCVMGIEPGTGLCNAVILAPPGADFISRWQEHYRNFDGKRWNYHSVVLPGRMAQESPDLVRLAGKYDFFYPTHNDPVCAYLWGQRPSVAALAVRMGKNLVRLAMMALQRDDDRVRRAFYQTFHGLRGREWHFRRACRSYCLHLWEGLWGEPYLKQVTPAYLQSSDSNFARLMRRVITAAEIEALTQGRLAEFVPA